MVHDVKISAKDFSLSFTRSYLKTSKSKLKRHLKLKVPERRKQCKKCGNRTIFYCFDCSHNDCECCFAGIHGTHKKINNSPKRLCKSSLNCRKKTTILCRECSNNIKDLIKEIRELFRVFFTRISLSPFTGQRGSTRTDVFANTTFYKCVEESFYEAHKKTIPAKTILQCVYNVISASRDWDGGRAIREKERALKRKAVDLEVNENEI